MQGNDGNIKPLRVKGDVRFGHWGDDAEFIKISCDGANGFLDFNGAIGRLMLNASSKKDIFMGGGLEIVGDAIVGSSNANKRLHVFGEIDCKKVKVCSSGWCDYVFENNYKLTPLLDVEKYIKENKHLPEVPSAEEVAKEEVDLFEMQKIQMKKIEELTLYMIELKKENQELRKEIRK